MQLANIMAISTEVAHLVAFPASPANHFSAFGLPDDARKDGDAPPIDDLSLAVSSRSASGLAEYATGSVSAASPQMLHGLPPLLASATSCALELGAVLAVYMVYRRCAYALLERLLK